MKIRWRFGVLLVLLFSLCTPAFAEDDAAGTADKEKILTSYGKLPIYFIENKGQLDPKVRFYVKTLGQSVYFTEEGIVFDFLRGGKTAGKDAEGAEKIRQTERKEIERLVFNLGFENAQRGILIDGLDRQDAGVNYFTGNDRSKWKTGIPTYKGVVYKGVYKGIDLKVFGNGKNIEYEFIVNPGGNPDDILLTYNGIEGLAKNGEGELLVATAFGELKESRPYIYQEIKGKRAVDGKFEIRSSVGQSQTGKFSYGFQVASYDPSYSLIIDPILHYSTYLGGSAPDYGRGIAVDGSRNAYVTGETQSDDFPTQNPYQESLGGADDAFVLKYEGENNISGTVSGIAVGTSIQIQFISGDPCGYYQVVRSGWSDPFDGTFTIGVPAGTYYLWTHNGGANYTNEWWATSASTVNCSGAESFTVTDGTAVPAKNFQLDTGYIISGIVRDSGGTPITQSGIGVQVMTGDPCGTRQMVGWASYNVETGAYQIGGLLAGTYYLQAYTWGDANYVSEWWASSGSVFECGGAQSITVSTANIPDINFNLDAGATISGTVSNTNDTPITGIQINVTVYSGDPCGSYEHIVGSLTDSAYGTYSITGVPAGTYFLRTWSNGTAYQGEWWADAASTVDCSLAESFTVNTGTSVEGKNFQLAEGGIISGTVYKADGITPITEKRIRIIARSGYPCGSYQDVQDGWTDTTNGTYIIGGLPAGTYYLWTDNQGANYTNEWWASTASTTVCDDAQPIAVSIFTPATGVDFQLSTGYTISGIVRDSGGTPIKKSGVGVQVITGNLNACSIKQTVGWASYNTTDGTYVIGGVPPGTYYLQAYTWGDVNYVSEWWKSSASVVNCVEAEPIIVSTANIPDKNFNLDAGATISGTVCQSNATPITGSQIHVNVYSGTPCGTIQHIEGAPINSTNGTYSIMRVPEGGPYYLLTWNNGTFYQNEWWADPASTVDCNDAETITTTILAPATGKDFQLDTGATITGTVTSDTGGTIAGIQVCGWPFPGGVGGNCTTTQADGSYSLSGLPPGYIKVEASGAGYLTEYYNNTYDPGWATAVWAPAGQITPNINFSMGKYGSISGTVYKSDGTTPLPNVCVDAYRHECASNPFASAQSDSSGNYFIENLPPQAYYLKTGAACTYPQHYEDLWWKSGGGVMFCDQAGAVNVDSELTTEGIDFSLASSTATYPGPSFRSAGVFSHRPADSGQPTTTTFFAFIDGPGPEDVASFTATGPSGTFNLTLSEILFIQLGNIYVAGSASVVSNGTYTFVVTDSLGRTATIERIFTYDSTVPQVDSGTMKVNELGGNQTYVGATAPYTLTWDAVAWPGTPGYYQAFVYDYDGRAIWYVGTTEGTSTSITIPEGYLQPNTAYYWWVRACDIPTTGEQGQNRRYSNTLYFYTGTKGLPVLTTRSLLSYITPDSGWANWFGISRVNLAPWDIDLYDVTGPEGTQYYYNGRLYLLMHPMFYTCWSPGPAPTPGGTYTFKLKDNDSNESTETSAFIYNPSTPIPEATRSPAPNAYLYTKTPTFSWTPPGSGTFYYNLRIYDYLSRIHWYSENTTNTSITLSNPSSAPPGSYKWEVRAYTDPEYKNGAFSSKRTFTIPPISNYPYTLPGGTGQFTDYRIFTVPYYMGTGADFLKALEKSLGPYNQGRWRIFGVRYPDNVEINSADFASWSIIPGMGFWIITIDGTTIEVEGTACPQNMDYKLKLPDGWSLVALPWTDTNVALGNIQVTDGTNTSSITAGDLDPHPNMLTQRCVWSYTGNGPYNGYEKLELSTDTLQCGVGYFLKVVAGTEVTLIFPAATNQGSEFMNIEKGSTGNEDEPPPPPGGEPNIEPFPCPDCSNGRLEGAMEFPFNADCDYKYGGTFIINGSNIIIRKGARVAIEANHVDIKSFFHAEPGAVVTIKQTKP